MRENRPSGSEGGAGAKPLFLPLSFSPDSRLLIKLEAEASHF
jgi:hypothetical protein